MKDFVFYSSEFNLSELAEKETQLENHEVVLCKNFSEKELQELKEKTRKEKFSVKFFFCHLLFKSDSKEINKFKNKADFIGVFGGNVSLNKFAVSNKKIDFLFAPCSEGKLTFDTAIARIAKENSTEILIPFSSFLNAVHSKRVSLAKNYSFMLKLSSKFKLNVLVVSFAKNFFELRSVKELEAFKSFLEKKFEKIIE